MQLNILFYPVPTSRFFSAGSVADVTEIRPDSGDLLPAPVRFPKSATFQQDLLFRYFTEKKKTI